MPNESASIKKEQGFLIEYTTEFSVPQVEEIINDDFFIRGTAISETITHNGHKYIAEELQKSASTLMNKPLLVDHNNSIESIKGKVIKAYFEPKSRTIQFEAKIMDKNIREMVRDGRISTVSIGAYAQELVKDEDGSYIAKGIKFAELSLVAVPADENATFAMAMYEAFHTIQEVPIITHINEINIERRDKKMTDELNSALQEKLKLQEESTMKLQEELKALRADKRKSLVEKYKELCSVKNVKEKDISTASDETVSFLIEQLKEITLAVEPKTELKAQVHQTKEMPQALNNFMVESQTNGKGYAMWAMPDSRGRIKTDQW